MTTPPSKPQLDRAVRLSLGEQRAHQFRMNVVSGFGLLETALFELATLPWPVRFFYKKRLESIITKLDEAQQMFKKA